MKERPILFSAPMVRALLAGTKTQTRRVVKPHWPESVRHYLEYHHPKDDTNYCVWGWDGEQIVFDSDRVCPYGKPGDRLWVRETWVGPMFIGDPPLDWMSSKYNTPAHCHYRASGDSCEFFDLSQDRTVQRWIPSIHMPRWASRITLEVTGVRVERLQEISEADAVAEGIEVVAPAVWRNYIKHDCPADAMHAPSASYRSLWESINGPGSWDANPWVWVIEFKRLTP